MSPYLVKAFVSSRSVVRKNSWDEALLVWPNYAFQPLHDVSFHTNLRPLLFALFEHSERSLAVPVAWLACTTEWEVREVQLTLCPDQEQSKLC